MQQHQFTLFVTGESTTSAAARQNLQSICGSHLANRCEVVVVDVLEHPDIAEASKVMATPTLIKSAPGPVRRIIGDLSDRQRVLAALGLPNLPASKE
jgi:circadian clock protein KaiB